MGVFFCLGGYAARWRAALFPKLVGREQRPVGLESFPQFLRELWNDGGEAGLIPSLFVASWQTAVCLYAFLFVPEKEAKRARRSDAAAAGRGCGPGPQDAAT